MFLEISQNSQETPPGQVFSCESCETSKEHLFYRTPLDDWFWYSKHKWLILDFDSLAL